MFSLRTALLVASVGLAAGCEPGEPPARGAAPPTLEPLPPRASLDGVDFEPAVLAQLERAREEVVSRPGDPEANGRYGMALHAYDLFDQAAAVYRRAARLDPSDFRWWHALGRVQIRLGDEEEAVRSLERAVALRPDSLATLVLLGELALQSDAVERARDWFERAMVAAPGSVHAALGLGQVRFREGDVTGAITWYAKALEVVPSFSRAHYAMAMAQRKARDLEKARFHLAQHESGDRNVPARDPLMEEIERLRLDSDHALRTANSLFKRGKYEEAIALYRRTLELNPEQEKMAQYNIGLCLQHLGKPAEAIPYYRKVIEGSPDSVATLNNLGLAHSELGKPAEAIPYFEKAIAVEPTYYTAHFNLGLGLATLGRTNEAIASFEKALAIRPEEVEAHFNLALLLKRSGDHGRAASHWLAMLARRPDDPRAHYHLLRALAPGERSRASSASYRKLAALLKAKGLPAAAIHSLRSGLREAPEDWRNAIALAWVLATSPDASLRRPEEAVQLAEPVAHGVAAGDPRALDTLAAAYAAAGRFADARHTAEEAVRRLAERGDAAAHERLAEGLRRRLALYAEGRPYLDEPAS